MSYESFYRHIFKREDKYMVRKGDESYGTFDTLAEALFERDRFIAVDWNWDKYVELAETPNNYIHIDLPPFHHSPSFIAEINESWMVRGYGRRQKYYGTYKTEEEAVRVARIYNARITHYLKRYRVQREFNGKKIHYGTYKTREEAEDKVKELMECEWNDICT